MTGSEKQSKSLWKSALEMYNFNGDFRRRPEQNFSGQSRKPDRESVIRKAQLERLKREEARLQETSAFVIQSFFRSCHQRQTVKAIERGNFDAYSPAQNAQVSVQQLDYLLKRFIFFYDHSRTEDGQRLVSYCTLLLPFSSPDSHSWAFFTAENLRISDSGCRNRMP